MPTVVSFINYKGGVGKTTSAYHVACSLVQHRRQRVLMIDIDPQTNLTFLCASIEQWERRKQRVGTIKNLYEQFTKGQALEVRRFIWNDAVVIGRHPISGLDMIPCDIELLGEDLSRDGEIVGTFPTMQTLRQNAQRYMRERSFLTRVIEEVSDRYDWVIIDCPPNLYLMTQNALHASDYYVVTAIPDHLSTIGLNILTRKVREIGEGIAAAQPLAGESGQPVAELGGIVVVKVRLGGNMITNTHEATMNAIASSPLVGDKVFRRNTTELIGYSEAAENRIPVWEHNSENARRAAQKNEYPSITLELVNRLGP
jgi:chromosome partitioning protein